VGTKVNLVEYDCRMNLNKFTVQIITSVVGTILYLLFILLFGGKIGMTGIILSMAVCYILMSALHLYQCRLLISEKAKGITFLPYVDF
jgi:hypothetical protein